MNKKRICLLLAIVAIFLFKIDVNAAGTCTADEKKALQIEANNLSITYELIKETDERSDLEYYYTITISNYSDTLLIKEDHATYNSTSVNSDGEIILSKSYLMGKKVVLYIKGSEKSNCSSVDLATKVVNLPYYNKYSEREECKELSEYDICKTNVNTSNLSEEQFLNEISKAQQKENEKNVEEPKVEEDSIIKKIVNFYKENLIITLPVTIILLIMVISIIYLKKKKQKEKIKIDFEKI